MIFDDLVDSSLLWDGKRLVALASVSFKHFTGCNSLIS